MPLFLSNKKEDWFFYEDFLKKLNIFPPPFGNLKNFSTIRLVSRNVKTIEQTYIEKVKIIKEGVILKFSLSKGIYATTFLAHLFCLVSGVPQDDISSNPVDIKSFLGEKSLDKTLDYFQKVIHSKKENIFEKNI